MHDLRCVGVCCRKPLDTPYPLWTSQKVTGCTVYRNDTVILHGGHCSCDHVGHLDVMHHFGNPDGKHYCPTGFILCFQCGAIGHEPDPPLCTTWEGIA